MNCVICQMGTTEPGFVLVTSERDNAILVIKYLPASVCTNGGERCFDAATTDLLLPVADRAFAKRTELEIIRLQVA